MGKIPKISSELLSMVMGFQENGHITMERRNAKTGESEEREVTESVEKNWEVYPLFGEHK
ncbi:hypothetical protein [Paenibacillus marchantiophytorum]|nr:hypothetical protein [Paenibacillus marchantiophytorum]